MRDRPGRRELRYRRQQRTARRLIALVPVHNEVDTIATTVRALQKQTRPPDEIFVCIDTRDYEVAEMLMKRVAPLGVSIIMSVNNPYRKAGNLNGAIHSLAPSLSAYDILCGFDADSVADPRFLESAVHYLERGYGAVGATFHGRKGGRLLGVLQRAEFARFAEHQTRRIQADVLSGTGWVVWYGVLHMVAQRRESGMVYDVRSLVEDYELTLALLHADVDVIAPGSCRTTTDVMETLKDWHSQRLRWQHGTLEELRRYGITHKTWQMVCRQATMYVGMIATPLTALYLTWSFVLFSWQGLNPTHAKLYMWCVIALIVEQAFQARKAGILAVISTVLIVPDLFYSFARQVVYIRALYRVLRKKKTSWGAGSPLLDAEAAQRGER